VDPDVRVGRREEPVEIDRLDRTDRRRAEPACRRDALDDGPVRSLVRLAGVELDDEMDIRQRPVEEPGKHDRVVELPKDRPPRPRNHDQPGVAGDPQLLPDAG
jgi:hypothetical protein